MKFHSGSWLPVDKAGFSSGFAEYTSIAIDRNGTPFVVYQDGSTSSKATVMKLDTNLHSINGLDTVCLGFTSILNDATLAGTWSSSNTSIATVASGIVTGISIGTAIISYTVSGNAAIFTVSVNPCSTGISNINNPAVTKFSAYPNPTTTELTITSTDKITSIAITNLIGQTVYSNYYHNEKVQVNVSDLPAGMYLVRINGTEVGKFVKE